MSYAAAIKAANDLTSELPFLGSRPSRQDYEDAHGLVEYLIEHDPDSPLVEMLTAKIDNYENESPVFAEFNARVASIPSGVALLRTLMDQYQLTHSDFENKIGKKSLVSRIINGQRTLTLDHMRALAKRFGVPVSAFVGN
ncbi:helix-turn-helix domain-containing protein [Enterobacter asburiae]|jgi:HTH-type transcriptional regulator/antitoxin HigA|uniref:helix-turn-helix domain-containing protein n=1 Tax=Enterobacter asburiae TaxID=61645 RepID=UPI00288A597F|nr:helix-turn-helix domain-containing protein [Enterobacter asburiae]WNI65310.1 helix-turn-helix domain-containing protein [Enterobacter asburiae]WNI66457.1 helix-turn-helix domain-containing protein [Enterobacter asburiae]